MNQQTSRQRLQLRPAIQPEGWWRIEYADAPDLPTLPATPAELLELAREIQKRFAPDRTTGEQPA